MGIYRSANRPPQTSAPAASAQPDHATQSSQPAGRTNEPVRRPVEGEPPQNEEMKLSAIAARLLDADSRKAIEDAARAGKLVAPDRLESFVEEATNDAINYVSDRSAKDFPKLVQCDPDSIVRSVAKLASLSLTANRTTQSGFLRPGFNKNTQRMEAGALPGIRGMEKMVTDCTAIISRAIRRQDREKVVFHPTTGVPYTVVEVNYRPEPGLNDIVGATATIFLKDGSVICRDLRMEDTGKGVLYSSETGHAIESGMMGIEKAAEYTARRAVLREYANTRGAGSILTRAFAIESDSYDADATESIRQPSARVESAPTVQNAEIQNDEEEIPSHAPDDYAESAELSRGPVEQALVNVRSKTREVESKELQVAARTAFRR